jgi:hypothetical protein
MSPNCKLFVERLQSLNPNDDYLETELYNIMALVEESPDSSEVTPYIFAFFEANPDAESGSPGPLVHFLEKQPEYQTALISSIEKAPVRHTTLMINRILNSKISSEKRAFFTALLQSILTQPRSDETTKEITENFLKRQTSN